MQKGSSIAQTQGNHQNVVGDHAAGKKHRDNNDLHENLVAHQVVFGQGIGEHDRHQHSDGSTADGINKGIAICLEKVGVGEDLLVSIQVKADWPEQDLELEKDSAAIYTNGKKQTSRVKIMTRLTMVSKTTFSFVL